MFKSLLLLTLSAATLAAGTASADVYRYTDEKGNIQYTDKPPSLPAERLNVQSQRTDVVAATTNREPSKPATPPPPSREQVAAQKEVAQLNAKDKVERCSKARERYDRYMNSQKLYEQSEGGERRYLTSDELDTARASAKASMDVMCQ